MKCFNCDADLESGSKFCVKCGQFQGDKEEANQPPEPVTTQKIDQAKAESRTIDNPIDDGTLVLRASDSIWNFEENEGVVKPGKKRPLLILDEQAIHIINTEKELSPELLFERVKQVIKNLQSPVEVELVKARWLNDKSEQRDRIVANLKNHPRKDLKMLMGLDYLGKWASFYTCLGLEPEIKKEEEKFEIDKRLLYAGGGSALLFLIGLIAQSATLIILGIFGAIGTAVTGKIMFKKHRAKKMTNKAKEQAKKIMKRVYRSYKYDDLRLFNVAMEEIYKCVIDDIISQGGGEKYRVEGGKGNYFQESDVSSASQVQQNHDNAPPTARTSDAASLEV